MDKRIIRAYAFTAVFCTSIALVLWRLQGDSLRDNLIVSFCIGISICTMYLLVWKTVNNSFPRMVSSFVISAIGLVIGLFAAGYLLIGDPFLFFFKVSRGLILGIFFGAIGTIIYVSHMRLIEVKAELAMAAAREAEQAKLTAETQLQLLQAQIEPHFLFNTLSNIHSLIDHRPNAAQETLENLTTLLRRSLTRTREESITLLEEVDILRAYLDIQKIRMGDRLEYEIRVPTSLHAYRLPPLLLQPLVENSVVHGLDTADGGCVVIDVTEKDNALVMTVTDNGVGINLNPAVSKTPGLGLANVRARIQTLYGDKASLVVANRTSDTETMTGVIATLTLPVATSLST